MRSSEHAHPFLSPCTETRISCAARGNRRDPFLAKRSTWVIQLVYWSTPFAYVCRKTRRRVTKSEKQVHYATRYQFNASIWFYQSIRFILSCGLIMWAIHALSSSPDEAKVYVVRASCIEHCCLRLCRACAYWSTAVLINVETRQRPSLLW